LARVLLAQGELGAAERLLERLLQSAESAGRMGRVIEILILQALTRQAQGETNQALTALERALSLAEPEGYIRMSVDEGEPMCRLISDFKWQIEQPAHRQSERLTGYVDTLLAAFPHNASVLHSTVGGLQPTATERLTRRELEILRLIAEGRSYQAIAQELVIAFSTVQTYIRRIYRKLDAHNGLEAVAHARQLKLL
jgi:LuxR family maltose regulon positive regulatory protein